MLGKQGVSENWHLHELSGLAALCYQSVLGALVLTPFALGAGITGADEFLAFFALIGVLQSLSHGLSITAFRFAPASVLAPLVYLEIVAAVVVGLIGNDSLARLASIVRGVDTNRHDLAPESAGLLAVSLGLSRMYRDDLAQLEAGITIYNAFYRWARDATGEDYNWPATSGKG